MRPRSHRGSTSGKQRGELASKDNFATRPLAVRTVHFHRHPERFTKLLILFFTDKRLRFCQITADGIFRNPQIRNRLSIMKTAMKRFIRQVAKKSSMSQAEAADAVDRLVHDLVCKLRKGEQSCLPGVGMLEPTRTTQIIKEINGQDTPVPTDRRRSY